MKKFKPIVILIFATILLLNSSNSIVNGDSDLNFFKEGSISRAGWNYYRNEPLGDFFGIDWVMNVSSTEEISFNSLSDQFYNITKILSFQIEEAYQIANGIRYNPISFGIRYYDEFGFLVANENSSFTFELRRNINKTSGKITLANNPYGAAKLDIVAYYDSTKPIYAGTQYPKTLDTVGSLSEDFFPNVTDWTLGGLAFPDLTVVEETKLGDFDMFKILNNENVPGTDQSVIQILVEKTTGLRVSRQVLLVKNNDFHWEIREWVFDIEEIIGNQGQSSPFIESTLILAILLLYSLKRKKKSKKFEYIKQ